MTNDNLSRRGLMKQSALVAGPVALIATALSGTATALVGAPSLTITLAMNLFLRNAASVSFVVSSMMLPVTICAQTPRQTGDASVPAEADETVHPQTPGHLSLDRPGDREFVLDKANMISDADKQKIKQIADKLLTDKAAPIIVVTIESMAKHGGAGMRIETFARLLFDQWGIGPAKLGDTQWNYGMLLLVSKQDRQARIELGAGWKREKDAVAQKIMEDLIIPRLKSGNFSGGIVAGVEGLDKMARDLELPTRPRPTSHYIVGAVFVGLMVFTIISLIRRGASGWAWLMWAAVFGVIGVILYNLATNRSSGGGGGFSGGSFGGGFSGGGGATGSW